MSSTLPGRSSDRCFCCDSQSIRREWGVVSPFFGQRALGRGPEPVPMIRCNACRSCYFDVTPTDEELGRLYGGYRGESYFRQRNHFEPWYTRVINDALGAEEEMQLRRNVLNEVLAESGIAKGVERVLDHGGDRGQMLAGLDAATKAVYDISGVEVDPGVIAIGADELHSQAWDLILCCHVLEHLPDPQGHLNKLLALGHPGTFYFFEVPNENFRSLSANGWSVQRLWLSWLTKQPQWLFRKFDFLSQNFDYRLNFVPPLFFFPLCEHLSFFTKVGLSSFLGRSGFQVKSAAVRRSGHIAVLAMKP